LLDVINDLDVLGNLYIHTVREYKETSGKIPYALIEAIKFAINRFKAQSITDEGLIMLGVTFFKESHRAVPSTPETPLGEHAPVEKLKDLLFLIEDSNLSADFILTDDSISEKRDVDGEMNTTYI